MTSENASDAMNSTRKPVRFETPTSTTTDLPSIKGTKGINKPPKGYALTLVSTFAVMLRQHLSLTVQKAAESHIDLLHKFINKMNQYKKMGDDREFIPRSARMVNFDFRVTKKVEDNPEFLVVKADTDALMLEFKLALKRKIMETLQIQCKILRDELYENLNKYTPCCPLPVDHRSINLGPICYYLYIISLLF